eukprot:Tamp_23597.p1 GENE.Tamp_23597~~Tamp_23597.p1  ORF type:complete len:191 (-),score=2.69 Tamp_23597:23-595(-)
MHGMACASTPLAYPPPCMPASVANAHGDCDCDVSLITQAQHAHGIRQALITSLHTPAANARLSSLSQQDLGSFAKKAQKPSRLFFARPSASAPLPLSLYASLTMRLSHYAPLSLRASLTMCQSLQCPSPRARRGQRKRGCKESAGQRATLPAHHLACMDYGIWPTRTCTTASVLHALQHLVSVHHSTIAR